MSKRTKIRGIETEYTTLFRLHNVRISVCLLMCECACACAHRCMFLSMKFVFCCRNFSYFDWDYARIVYCTPKKTTNEKMLGKRNFASSDFSIYCHCFCYNFVCLTKSEKRSDLFYEFYAIISLSQAIICGFIDGQFCVGKNTKLQ